MTKPKKPRDEAVGAEDQLSQFLLPERLARLESVLANRSEHLTVVLDNVHNYHNISAVIRSSDAFGLCDVHLVGDSFDYSRGISLGAEQWVRLHRHETPSAAAEALLNDGYRLVLTAPEEQTTKRNYPIVRVDELPFSEKLALVFGNERHGVSKELEKAVTLGTFIPMFGFVESFNISVACAICLFCSTQARRNVPGAMPPLPEDTAKTLKADWLKVGIRRSDVVLREIKRRSQQE